MPDLTLTLPSVTPTPTSSANVTGPVADGPKSNDGTASTSGEASFASTLKSKMDKSSSSDKPASKPADQASDKTGDAADATTAADTTAASAQVPAGTAPAATATGADLAALLPLLAGLAPALQQAAAVSPQSKEKAIDSLVKDPEATPLALIALPTAGSHISTSLGHTAQGTESDAASVTGRNAASNTPQFLPGTNDAAANTGGKLKGETAISAEANLVTNTAGTADQAPLGDFRAQLERAGAAFQVGQRPPPEAGNSLHVATPINQAGWHEDVGQKLTWMVGNQHHQADLVLTPPQLGRVEVSLTLQGDQAQAIFTSLNPQVREALEDSLPRLRQILADAGVTLGQAQVGSESPNQSSNQGEKGESSRFGRTDNGRYPADIGRIASAPPSALRSGRGMVDVFA